MKVTQTFICCFVLFLENQCFIIYSLGATYIAHYNAFCKISHVRLLYPVAFGNLIKHRFLEFPHDRTFLVKHIKAEFIMTYLHDLPVTGHEHIDIGCITRIKRFLFPYTLAQTENAFPQINITRRKIEGLPFFLFFICELYFFNFFALVVELTFYILRYG